MHGVILRGTRFKNLNSIGPNGSGMSVAVPSRLYHRPCPSKPLAGVRIGIKDNFKLAGTKSAVGNRAFLNTYDEDEETAAFIKTLIDLGAIIVGKTKMTAFASGEKPIDWFDFQCPFNPRGDGYQDPSSSSSGAENGRGLPERRVVVFQFGATDARCGRPGLAHAHRAAIASRLGAGQGPFGRPASRPNPPTRPPP